MANIFKEITQGYHKANKAFDQFSIIILILAIGFLIVYFINNPKKNDLNTDNTNFLCAQTSDDKLQYPETTDLQTATQLALINVDTEIFITSLSRNDIPAVTEPIFSDIKDVSSCITDNEPVLVLKYQDEIKIYPRQILNYHIAVNDKIADLPVLISYSPLADHFEVFDRTVKNEPLMFGVSGSLYKNSDLLFDTKTESLWSQFDGRALVGNAIGAKLVPLPFSILPFKQAIALYPNAQVLSFQTGFRREYNLDPFVDYRTNEEIIGKVTYSDATWNKKENVYGFQFQGKFYAFDIKELENVTSVSFMIDGNKFTFKNDLGMPVLTNTADNTEIPLFSTYWFVWYDFHPNTEIINF